MPPRPIARLLSVAVAAGLTVALVAGCASLPGSSPVSQGPTSTVGSIDAGPTATPVALPEQRLDAGTVATGSPVTVTGTGSAVIGFVRGGDFGVVARVDCTGCSGAVTVRDPDAQVTWGSGVAPLSGSYLVDLRADDRTDRSLVLETEGSWSIELSSWADLPVVTGPQSGTGATVLRLGDAATTMLLGYTPADADDELVGRAVAESDLAGTDVADVLVFGSESAVQDAPVPVAVPGVVGISTVGTWSLTAAG